MKRLKAIRGVEIHETKSGAHVVYIRFQSGGRQYTERVGESVRVKGRDVTIAKARRLLERRRREIAEARAKGEVWRSPKVQAVEDRQRRVAAEDSRRALLFEVASERFITSQAHEYADPREIKAILRNRLAKAFHGRYLDEITRKDIREYYIDRMNATGPFQQGATVSVRCPEVEIRSLSALYTFLLDEEYDLSNPCHRPQSRRKDSPLRAYRPKHQVVIPSDEARVALFTNAPTPESRALFKLCYYTGARPESEPCRLNHGDIAFSDGNGWGRVVYRDTKTGGSRELPLHPEVEADLRAIMLPIPIKHEDREGWSQTPIFRKRGSGRHWDQSSYLKAWRKTVAATAKAHEAVATMWLRHFRNTFKTVLTDAKQPAELIGSMMGHAAGVAEGYYQGRWAQMQDAISCLSLAHVGRVSRRVSERTGTDA